MGFLALAATLFDAVSRPRLRAKLRAKTPGQDSGLKLRAKDLGRNSGPKLRDSVGVSDEDWSTLISLHLAVIQAGTITVSWDKSFHRLPADAERTIRRAQLVSASCTASTVHLDMADTYQDESRYFD